MYEDIKHLIEEFEKLPKQDVKDETFISIIRGKAQDEKVSSNVLAFFLDTTREHNLGDLFVKSLLESIDEDVDSFNGDFVSETEYLTNKEKRIDIVLINNSVNVVIENKIYADLYNDLKDYYDSVKDLNNNSTIGIVLSLSNISDDYKNKYAESYYADMGFMTVDDCLQFINAKYRFITYELLFKNIKKNIGCYVQRASKKYLPLFLDYIDNIENLKIKQNMNTDLVKFIKESGCKIDGFAGQLNELKKYIDDELKTINNEISDKIQNTSLKTKIWGHSDDEYHYFDILAIEYKVNNAPFILDCKLSFDGWSFYLFTNRSDKAGNRVKDNKIKKYKTALEANNFKCTHDGMCGKYIVTKEYKTLDVSKNEVVDYIYNILKVLVPSEFSEMLEQ